MSFRIRAGSIETPVNNYEPMNEHEIEIALNEEIAHQINGSVNHRTGSTFVFDAPVNADENYDTLSFLDAYEHGQNEMDIQPPSSALSADMNADMNELMGDKAQLEWYQRVMKWTHQNRSAYLRLKTLQTSVALLLLGVTFILYHFRWMKTRPDEKMIYCIRLLMAMMIGDVFTFLCDFIMILKRMKFFISLRYIACAISFTIGVIVQTDFFLESYNSGDVKLDFRNSIHAWIFFMIVYVYQGYIIWGVINLMMYCQIVEQEKREY
jgi:hypothetical protein